MRCELRTPTGKWSARVNGQSKAKGPRQISDNKNRPYIGNFGANVTGAESQNTETTTVRTRKQFVPNVENKVIYQVSVYQRGEPSTSRTNKPSRGTTPRAKRTMAQNSASTPSTLTSGTFQDEFSLKSRLTEWVCQWNWILEPP
jgi:hypothetical protein